MTSNTAFRNPLLSRILLGAMVIVLASQTAKYLFRHDFQWDFVRNRSAAYAHSLGLNPYSVDEVRRVAPESPEIMFPYVPHTLFYFGFFNQFTPFRAGTLYFVAKLLCLFLLFALWTRTLLRPPWNITEWFALLFAFNTPIVKDLNSGNISVFEQVGLFGAIYLLMKGRPWIAMLLIVAIAQFKLIPIALLGLLLTGHKIEWKPFIGGGLLFLGIVGINFLLMPVVFQQFLASLGTHEEYGSISPGTLTIIRDIVTTFGLESWQGHSNQIFVVVVALVMSWSIFVFVSSRRALGTDFTIEDRVVLLLFSYFMCAPWFKNYSYLMLLPLTVYLYRQLQHPAQRRILLALILISAVPIRTDLHPILRLVSEYNAYIVGMICYVWFTRILLARSDRGVAAQSALRQS